MLCNCTCFLWLVALITAILEWTCKKQVAVRLLIYGLLPLPFCCPVGCQLSIFVSPMPNKEDREVVVQLGVLVTFGVVFLFYISWVLLGQSYSSLQLVVTNAAPSAS